MGRILLTDNLKDEKFVTVSSLDKVFPKDGPKILQSKASTMKNETFHFQASFYSDRIIIGNIQCISDLSEYITIRAVESIPAHFAKYEGLHDDYVIEEHGSGELFPDLLRPVYTDYECMRQKSWKTYWITVDGSKGLPVGTHEIVLRLDEYKWGTDESSGNVYECKFTLEVIDDELPNMDDFLYTGWMHYDCICYQHKVEPYTDAFYKLLGAYVDSAVKHGMTMLYTPLFTPSLDTKIGTYRRNVQLVDVEVLADGTYKFGFEKAAYFMDFALAHGVKHFELCHIASQWGAKKAIGVYGKVNGKEERIFGWQTDADSPEYLAFLDSFFCAFSKFVEEKGYGDKLYFHISDEPQPNALERFQIIKNTFSKYFPNAEVMDALSDGEFSRSGIITKPFVCLSHYKENSSAWVYYCGCQRDNYLTNRHLAMPSQRNRIFGAQLYRNGCKGFLHWGFNFYNTGGSRYPIDPYLITDAGGCFDGGDPFIVYPAENGVNESLRHEVLGDAFADFRALRLLEKYVGREETIRFLDDEGVKLGFSEYPRDAQWHHEFRFRLNEKIKKAKENS